MAAAANRRADLIKQVGFVYTALHVCAEAGDPNLGLDLYTQNWRRTFPLPKARSTARFFVFVYAEGPEVAASAHGPGTSPIGSATTRDAKVDVPSAAVHMYIPNLPKAATRSCTLMDHPRHVCQRDDTHRGRMVKRRGSTNSLKAPHLGEVTSARWTTQVQKDEITDTL